MQIFYTLIPICYYFQSGLNRIKWRQRWRDAGGLSTRAKLNHSAGGTILYNRNNGIKVFFLSSEDVGKEMAAWEKNK